jgi:hypothetical protein
MYSHVYVSPVIDKFRPTSCHSLLLGQTGNLL